MRQIWQGNKKKDVLYHYLSANDRVVQSGLYPTGVGRGVIPSNKNYYLPEVKNLLFGKNLLHRTGQWYSLQGL